VSDEIEDDERSGTGRLLAFSDGVFSIAFTLLTLDLVVPDGLGAGLDSALRAQLPHLLSALLGYAVIGRFWLAHHALFDRIRVVDRPLLLLNLLLLAPVALVPAVAGLIADYGDRTPAVVLYAAVVSVAAGAQLGVWLWASHGHRLTAEPDPEDESPRRTTAGLALASGAFAVSVPLAFVSIWAAQVCWLVALLPARWWLRWPRTGRSRAAGPGRRTRG
jgi:uncharacterized membrane protein